MEEGKNENGTKAWQLKIKSLIDKLGRSNCIKPDGTLTDAFILAFLVKSSKDASTLHGRLIDAFNVLKKEEVLQGLNPKVKKSTLKGIEFYQDYLVRPAKPDFNSRFDGVFYGTIIKLPRKLAADYFPGEGWKATLEENEFKIGDQVLYNNCKTNIVLDGENLHLVYHFIGKILEQNNNA